MCCGRDRAQLRVTSKLPSPRPANPVNRRNPQPRVSFVYAGNTGMSVTGPVSGIQYRFDHPGARVEVDPRDRVLLASLRQLRQVK
jgi:hypothetical protein